MTAYAGFYFIDTGTSVTHLAAWREDTRWSIPCGLIALPGADAVTYTPTKPLCKLCDRMTRQTFDRDAVLRRSRADG